MLINLTSNIQILNPREVFGARKTELGKDKFKDKREQLFWLEKWANDLQQKYVFHQL